MYSKKEDIATTLLDSINYPSDLKDLSIEELNKLSGELREFIINTVSKTGGHLGAGLGVTELTIALHHVFNTPTDQIVWDVSHQVYPHKALTGRKDRLHTLRQGGGLSGFAKRTESEYDCFGAGHGGTSISAALGMAVARDINSDKHDVIAVIGDGSLTAGMAYEAMNNAGYLKNRLIVILNDNEMAIAPNLGAMHKYLCRLVSSKSYITMRNFAKEILHKMPSSVESATKKAKQYAKDFIMGGNFFEEMGFNYIGPIDGHNLNELIPILNNIREDHTLENPILIHVKTQKGKGFDSPISCEENYHAVGKFDPETKIQNPSKLGKPTYTKVFAQTLINIAKQDESVVAITAAMPSGTGLNEFEKEIPNRMFDVGMSEQHAVTFGAGLATHNTKPFVVIYSTFLQRGYDQVVHDVALQNLPVRFMMDRAGVVGADGATHAGTFDIAYMANLPNMVVMAPSDEVELARMIQTSYEINDKPSCVRYPRGEARGLEMPTKITALEIAKGRIVKQGKDIAILSLGTRLEEVEKASEMLSLKGFDITIADARFAKPLDEEMILKLAKDHKTLITIEEGAVGGFGSHVAQLLASNKVFDNGLRFRSMFLPDEFIDHDTQQAMNEHAGLNAAGIINCVLETIQN